jgi:hypothetical protein
MRLVSSLSYRVLVITSTLFVALCFYLTLAIFYDFRDPNFVYNLTIYGKIEDYPIHTDMQKLGFIVLALINFLSCLVVVYSFLLFSYYLQMIPE